MVRPVPPTPSTSNFSENNGAASNEQLEEDAYAVNDTDFNREHGSVSEEDIRRRLGPGFSLRPSSSGEQGYNRTADQGALLYQGFLAEEFRRRNLPEPAELLSRESAFNRRRQTSPGDVLEAGNRLRVLAEEFSSSPMRNWVAQQAANAPLDELDFSAFSDLLYGLFQEGGVTWERVVVMFYFCSDLAIRAFREKLPRQLHNIVDWSFSFISGQRMLQWVIDNGGWGHILQKSVDNAYKIARIGFFLMGALAFAAYIWKTS